MDTRKLYGISGVLWENAEAAAMYRQLGLNVSETAKRMGLSRRWVGQLLKIRDRIVKRWGNRETDLYIRHFFDVETVSVWSRRVIPPALLAIANED